MLIRLKGCTVVGTFINCKHRRQVFSHRGKRKNDNFVYHKYSVNPERIMQQYHALHISQFIL